MTSSGLDEFEAWTINGFVALLCLIVIAAPLGLWLFLNMKDHLDVLPLLMSVITFLSVSLVPKGLFILKPGEAVVFTFFGNYSGTCRNEGFHFGNPLSSRQRISIKANNLATATLKVNDADGNPIEIAASIVWVVSDTAKAIFDVEDYTEYARIQAESALRQVASSHPYDHRNEPSESLQSEQHPPKHIISLRSDVQQVTRELVSTLRAVVQNAGLDILDARITHLAYAPEIAQAMLRRQQAQQVVAARQQIVYGAVTLTEEVIRKLNETKLVDLTMEDRSKLVINLLTVLVSETDAQPVLPMSNR